MQLSLRLSAIAGLVTRGNRLVDVGCDHGYLPVSLYLDGKIPGAIEWAALSWRGFLLTG